MAYRTIADAEIAVDAPIDVALLTAVRDNPKAIVEGDSGAPVIQISGLANSTVDGAADSLVYDSGTSSGQILRYPLNEYIVHSVMIANGLLNSNSAGTTNDLTSQAAAMPRGGEYTFLVIQRTPTKANDKVQAKILIDDAVVFTTNQTTGVNSNFVSIHTRTIVAGEVLKVKMLTETTDAAYGYASVEVLAYSANPFRDGIGAGQFTGHAAGTNYTGLSAHNPTAPTTVLAYQHMAIVT